MYLYVQNPETKLPQNFGNISEAEEMCTNKARNLSLYQPGFQLVFYQFKRKFYTEFKLTRTSLIRKIWLMKFCKSSVKWFLTMTLTVCTVVDGVDSWLDFQVFSIKFFLFFYQKQRRSLTLVENPVKASESLCYAKVRR